MESLDLHYFVTVADENGFPMGIRKNAATVREFVLKTRCNPFTKEYIFSDDDYIHMLNHY
jgi:hypothetical protein